ncbi:histidine triad nucleotide-binding protein [Abyssisolibacter fermentans]|uniref:histidine triad nucleotide-binding protein n=1 Tax=Abyssisolibacter fermentans TaxID=1766203 RepID=UPI00082AF231|nr:histidine triad nucleotide-binding protein [Abyssisolibacter fermentans]
MSDCLFCKIINGEIPCDKVFENEKVLAFNDIDPQAPVHILVIPKVHIESLNDINQDNCEIIKEIHLVIKKIAKDLKIDRDGYRVITNCGELGGQSVKHLHYHVLGGRNLKWPPG